MRKIRIPGLLLLLLAWPAAGRAQSLADAKAFVAGLYAAYAHGEPDYLSPPLSGRTFSPHLLHLMRRDEQLTPSGDVGALDGDPICDCQDAGGLAKAHVDVADAGPGKARAHAVFSLDGDHRDLTLDLVSVGGQWRVDDVHSADTPSLVKLFLDAHPLTRGR